MSYRTQFTLNVCLTVGNTPVTVVESSVLRDVIKELREVNEYAQYALTASGSPSGNDASWYGHLDDLRGFSEKYPNVLFTLDGEGEEAGDIWKKYFLNGKVQIAKAEIRVAEFDPKKLI